MSSNLSLAIIPFDNQECLHALPAVLYINLTGVTRCSLMEDAPVQGEEKSQRLEKGNMSTQSEGEHLFSSQDRVNSSDDENNHFA